MHILNYSFLDVLCKSGQSCLHLSAMPFFAFKTPSSIASGIILFLSFFLTYSLDLCPSHGTSSAFLTTSLILTHFYIHLLSLSLSSFLCLVFAVHNLFGSQSLDNYEAQLKEFLSAMNCVFVLSDSADLSDDSPSPKFVFRTLCTSMIITSKLIEDGWCCGNGKVYGIKRK